MSAQVNENSKALSALRTEFRVLSAEWGRIRIENRGLKIEDRKTAEREIRTLCALRSALCRFASALIGVNLRLKLFAGLA